jgi:hypothetical protein
MFDFLTPELVVALSILFYWLGSVTRAVWPYVLKRVETGVSFDWRYITGQALTSAGVFLLALFAGETTIESIGSLGIPGAFLLGFAASSLGRNGQKTVNAVRK